MMEVRFSSAVPEAPPAGVVSREEISAGGFRTAVVSDRSMLLRAACVSHGS